MAIIFFLFSVTILIFAAEYNVKTEATTRSWRFFNYFSFHCILNNVSSFELTDIDISISTSMQEIHMYAFFFLFIQKIVSLKISVATNKYYSIRS